MKRGILLLIIVIIHWAAEAQVGRQKAPLYGENSFQKRGWFFAPGITLMPSSTGNRFQTLYGEGELANDTLYNGRFNPSSRIGAYAEVGRHKFVEGYYLLHHFDYGIHFKLLRGKEEFAGQVNQGGMLIDATNKSTFSDGSAGAFINASNIIQIGDKTWIHNSLGLNFDFIFLRNRASENSFPVIPQEFPENIQLQLHYKLGFGFKIDPGLYVMPMVETPILNLYPTLDGKSTLPYFSNRYRPIIITIRFLFLDKTEGRKCVGKDTSGGKHDLWGKDMKKYNR